ncbi:MAG: RHS repeat domain-containing protein [Allosphingosinicella sp.]|uniref:RHS repeat domain-containing protein n=1 Tax=Allosphingosinicella sp. TaxID=2823234 RepID=UPI0039388429
MTHVREYGATSGADVLATFAYDNLGRRTSLTRGNGTVTSYGFDAASRLTSLTQNLAGTAHDTTLGFTYNPAGQIAQNTRSNDAYAWTSHYNVNRPYTSNGLNQYTAAGGVTPTYDARGNLTSAGPASYIYTATNQLTMSPGRIAMLYDPVGRLRATLSYVTGQESSYYYDGPNLILEYGGPFIARRYVHGPGVDEPLVWYEGAGTGDRRWLHADERGSIVAVTNGTGAAIAINAYDELSRCGLPPAVRSPVRGTGRPAQWHSGLDQHRAVPIEQVRTAPGSPQPCPGDRAACSIRGRPGSRNSACITTRPASRQTGERAHGACCK